MDATGDDDFDVVKACLSELGRDRSTAAGCTYLEWLYLITAPRLLTVARRVIKNPAASLLIMTDNT